MIYDCFRAILEDLNAAGRDEYGDEWEDKVATALLGLEDSYKELRDTNRVLIDYSELSAQTAYAFVYAVGRAEFTYEILRRFKRLAGKSLLGKSQINVVSIGGGPASELVGIVKYLTDPVSGETVTELNYDIYDKEGDWEHVASRVVDTLKEVPVSGHSYNELDLSNSAECSKIDLGNTDLVVLSFVISEICCVPNSAAIRANLAGILSTLHSGATVLYNDSDAYSFYAFMNSITAQVPSLNQIFEVQDMIAVSSPDFSGEFDEMIEQYERTPHLNSKAVAKLLVKS